VLHRHLKARPNKLTLLQANYSELNPATFGHMCVEQMNS